MLRSLSPRARKVIYSKPPLVLLCLMSMILLAHSSFKAFSIFFLLDSIPTKSWTESSLLGLIFTTLSVFLFVDMLIMAIGLIADNKAGMKFSLTMAYGLYILMFLFGFAAILSMRICTDECNHSNLSAGFSQYENDNKTKLKVDKFQSAHNCCGIEHFSDWNKFYSHSCLESNSTFCVLPSSCCQDEELTLENGTCNVEVFRSLEKYGDNQTKLEYYTDGCRLVVDNLLISSAFTFLLNCILMIVVQFAATYVIHFYLKELDRLEKISPFCGHESVEMSTLFTQVSTEETGSAGRFNSSALSLPRPYEEVDV